MATNRGGPVKMSGDVHLPDAESPDLAVEEGLSGLENLARERTQAGRAGVRKAGRLVDDVDASGDAVAADVASRDDDPPTDDTTADDATTKDAGAADRVARPAARSVAAGLGGADGAQPRPHPRAALSFDRELGRQDADPVAWSVPRGTDRASSVRPWMWALGALVLYRILR
ncbi:MAG TPA: hypothetical protein VFE82_15905 [Ramlibacter sp.]|jgi:hypothetical protein|uniref:hypothetical protein n=1 Tax=Ramlibacter sp. TaxID=1917967 RepID=UPI002D6B134D|nr:hypothetical protein [Ramlibacter sp.]HZY19957.1 hypothetical protein [Ramlibacter sp.]